MFITAKEEVRTGILKLWLNGCLNSVWLQMASLEINICVLGGQWASWLNHVVLIHSNASLLFFLPSVTGGQLFHDPCFRFLNSSGSHTHSLSSFRKIAIADHVKKIMW